MKYLIKTYRSFSKEYIYVELLDSSYGEWIIYEQGSPLYHVCCFGNESKSNLIFKKLIQEENLSIEEILKRINNLYNRKLKLGKKPLFALKINEELTELNLTPIPSALLEI